MDRIKNTIKYLIEFFASWVMIVGIVFTMLFLAGSIYVLETGNEYHYDLDLGLFVKNTDMAWFWVIIFTCFVIKMIWQAVVYIKKFIQRIKSGEGKKAVVDMSKDFIRN